MLEEGCETSRLGRAQDWRTQRAASFEQDLHDQIHVRVLVAGIEPHGRVGRSALQLRWPSVRAQGLSEGGGQIRGNMRSGSLPEQTAGGHVRSTTTTCTGDFGRAAVPRANLTFFLSVMS